MSAQPAPLNRQNARRFVRAVRDLLTSEVRAKAIGLLVLLLMFALSVNGLNVVSSYVGRDFMTAIADRDMPGFARLTILYVAVFAATTVVAVLYRFSEERLGLLWRSWLTKRVTVDYLARRTYLRLRKSADIDNSDQRIAEDIRAFTTTTLSFTLIFLNAILAAVSFSDVSAVSMSSPTGHRYFHWESGNNSLSPASFSRGRRSRYWIGCAQPLDQLRSSSPYSSSLTAPSRTSILTRPRCRSGSTTQFWRSTLTAHGLGKRRKKPMDEGSAQNTHNLINVNSAVRVCECHASGRYNSPQVLFTSKVV